MPVRAASLTRLGSHSSTRYKAGKGLGSTHTANKRIQITIETARVLKIRGSGHTRLLCPKCACEVDVVDPIQAEVLASTLAGTLANTMTGTMASTMASTTTSNLQPTLPASRALHQWHSVEAPDGTLFVCLNSLLKSL
jgi:hypothetical protein